MGLQRLGISNPSANTTSTIFTADNQYLISVISTNVSASPSTIRVWVEPSGASASTDYAYIVYNLPIDAQNSYETFRFAINQNDIVKVRSTSASVSFQCYGLVQYDINLGVGISSFQSASPTTVVDGLIWIDADGVIPNSSAKPVYVWSSNANQWLPFAGGDLNTAGNYTWTGTNNFSSNTSIGNVSSTELSYLDGVTSAIQTQLNNKENTIPLQATAPTSPSTSDLWVDSSGTAPMLKVYNGSVWTSLGSPPDDDQLVIAQRMFMQ